MSENEDLLRLAVCQVPDGLLQSGAGGKSTVQIIDIVCEEACRGPCEQHWNATVVAVMGDLGEAVETFCEERVVAMDEEEDRALALRFFHELAVQLCQHRCPVGQIGSLPRNEILLGIARQLGRPLDGPNLVVWRHRNAGLGVIRIKRAFAVEVGVWPVVAFPGRYDQNIVDAGIRGRLCVDCQRSFGRTSGAACHEQAYQEGVNSG